MADRNISALRRDLVDPTARLIEFLRKLASVRYSISRDVDDHLSVLWLANRPSEIDLDATAVAGDVLLAIDPVAAEPPPRIPETLSGWLDPADVANSALTAPELRRRSKVESPEEGEDADAPPTSVLRAFDAWLGTWKMWAEVDRRTALHRSWYDRLADGHQQLDQHSDEVELVLATGMLAWQSTHHRVRTHLLSTRLQVRVDADTGRLEVLVDPESTTRIVDRDLLGGEPGFDANRADPIRQQLRSAVPAPLGDEIKDLMERWRAMTLERCHPYEHDAWDPIERAEEDGIPQLRAAPAIILRRRDAATLLGYYDRMLEVLSGPDAEAPMGLAQLLTALEPEERLEWLSSEGSIGSVEPDPLFPLPANDEQRQILERLRHDSGVVVQGPPGTGKSHSIANLISALLAQGHRVLVTSQKAQALRVLRDKLPDDIAELCVSMTDLARGGSAELNRSVNALSEHFGSHDPAAHATRVEDLGSRRAAERSRVAALTEQIRALRESETYKHPLVAEGYEGTVGSIATRLSSQRDSCGWMPVPVPSDAPVEPPLSVAELGELRRLLLAATPARRGRTSQDLPAIDSLPLGPTVRGWFSAESAAAAEAGRAATELSQQLRSVDADRIDTITNKVRVGRQMLDTIGFRRGRAPEGSWKRPALDALLARRDAVVWEQLGSLAPQARAARDRLEAVGIRQVALPDFDPTGPASRGALLAAGRALRDYLAGGGTLRRHLAKPVQRGAQPLLDGASVDGIPPTTVELLDIVLAHMDADAISAGLAAQWSVVGLTSNPELPLIVRVGQLVEAAGTLEALRTFVQVRDDVERTLSAGRYSLSLDTLERWDELEEALEALAVQREADSATAHVAEQVASLELRSRVPAAPPELAQAASALAARDADAYERTLESLVEAHQQKAAQQRCDELWAKLHSAHPGLAQLLERTASSDDWDSRLAGFPAAWAWGKASTFFDDQRQAGRDQRLDAELADAVARFEAATVKLAAAEAWGHAMRRMDASQARALHVYRQAMSDRGAGKGRYAHKFEAAAREAMVAARGAVPAWIMPLPEVLETVPPDRNSFDVVIVDEASQASIEALFLLWLAPRVIVVGDDRQCTPSQVSHGELQPIFDSLDDYLPDVPHYLRVAFTPRSSLFSLLTTRFGAVLRLREHFRCMPEIIGWSSRQFYADAPLIPLRQFGAERLPPLRTTRVTGAYAEGTSTRLRNPLEAEAIVDAVVSCLEDPAYDGKTLGVVVLQGTGQIAMLLDLLHSRLPAAAWEQRRLRVGSPPDFQGDERDVIFLSMVVADPPRAVTMLEWQRRFNVAASRARDQMWLFHSVSLDALSPTDLRRSLLTYVAHPPAPDVATRLDDVRDDDPHPAFDSLFEQRVFNRIRARGYHVTPQLEVNGRRIDLVVTGAKGRLAVECDGDAWHTSAEQREADLHRELELKRAGWRFWRVRESEFYFDPEEAMSGLWAALEARGIRPHDLELHEEELAPEPGDDWVPAALSKVEGADGLDDDPLGVEGLDAVVPHRPPVPTRSAQHPSGFRQPSLLSAGQSGASGSAAVAPRLGGMPTSAEVRQWARSEGLSVGERGRLHPDVIAAWNEAHPDRLFY